MNAIFGTSGSAHRLAHPLRRMAGVLCLVLSGLLDGCISAKHYVDPGYAAFRTEAIKPPRTPLPVQVFFEFQNKTGSIASVTDRLKPRVVTFLANSGCFAQVTTGNQPDAARLFLTMTNFAVDDSSTAKGVGVGLTFGLVGAMVTDGYRVEATFRPAVGTPITRRYEHAMHSTIGNKDGPSGLTPLAAPDAINTILDQMLTRLLLDLFAEATPAGL